MSSARDPDEIDKINKIISELNLEKAKKAGLASPLTFIPASLQTWSKQAARDTDAVLQERVKDGRQRLLLGQRGSVNVPGVQDGISQYAYQARLGSLRRISFVIPLGKISWMPASP